MSFYPSLYLFEDGKDFDRLWKLFDVDGNGKIDGEAKYWSNDGYLINMVNYVNDQFHGEWIDYYKNGKTQHIINYAYGKKDGKEIWYYESGNVKSQVLYDNDKIISDIVRWDNNGKVIYE